MTVRRLRKKQRGPWCSYCEPRTSRAVFRGCGFRKFCCSNCRPKLEAEDEKEERMGGYQTEAEWQLGV